MTKNQKKALARLKTTLDLASTIRDKRNTQEFTKWHRDIGVAIEKLFGTDSKQVKEFHSIKFLPNIVVDGWGYDSRAQHQQAFESGLRVMTALIESILKEIETYGIKRIGEDGIRKIEVDTDKVFIVHGSDTGARAEVARAVEKLKIEPVILAEQANVGSTIIEKFELHANVGFAIVLLTPDDVGRSKHDDEVRPRARQNVIFEFGFFIGRLGRKRVCALTKGRVEIPSDYSGVLYIDMNQVDWKQQLVRELNTAGYKADANRLTGLI